MRIAPVVLGLAVASPALAGGVYVGESGSQAMERGGAFVAKADDPTALSINPAGLAKVETGEIYLGANLLDYTLTFQREGLYPQQDRGTQPAYAGRPYPLVENRASFQAVPYLAGDVRLGPIVLGAGVFGPAAVGRRDFRCEGSLCQVADDGAPAPQRYDIVQQTGLVAYPSLAAAYRIHPRVDVGVRLSWGVAALQARSFGWGVSNRGEDPLKDGEMSIDVSDPFVPAGGAGILVRPTDFLELGVAYTSPVKIEARGTAATAFGPEVSPLGPASIEPMPDALARCAPGGTVSAIKTCVDIPLPQLLAGGVRYVGRDGRGAERYDLEVDVKWENWSAASTDIAVLDGRDVLLGTPIQPVVMRHGFRDVWAVRVGGAYRFDVGRSALSVRAGASHDTAAAPTSWTRLDKDGKARTALAAGAAWEVDGWRFDAGFAVVLQPRVVVTDVPLDRPSYEQRIQPDVLQPSQIARNQPYHPINGGTYDSGYLMALLGTTRAF
jgi:long-chain fatty acid transport protein